MYLQCISKNHPYEVYNFLTVPEAAKAIQGWHFDYEGKEVIDEGVQCLVGEHTPW